MARKYLATAIVDVTFHAWWKVYGRKPETIQKALDRSRQQIGPPMSPDYVPPPWRSKAGTGSSSSKKATAGPVGEYDEYRRYAEKGIWKAKLELMKLEARVRVMNRWVPTGASIPLALLDQLAWLPCYVGGPDVQRREEEKVMNRYFAEHPEDAYLDPRKQSGSPQASLPEADDIFDPTLEEIEARRVRWLQELDWMTKNTIGAGAYGVARGLGDDHNVAMAKARRAQSLFDLGAAAATAHSQVRKGVPVTPAGTRPRNRTPRTTPQIRESTGASPRGSQFQSASARTARSMKTAIRADVAEAEGYKAALLRGEIGLQRPQGANVPGTDFITAARNAQGNIVIIVTDVKMSTIGRFPTPRSAVPPAWQAEVRAAVAPGRLNLNDPVLEQEIRAAVAAGRIRSRQLNADYSPAGQGQITGF
jgi:hypothetical protein